MAKREARLVPWGALNQAIEDHLATLSVDAFSDVTLTSEATGEVLYYNGSAWVNTDAITINPSGAVILENSGTDVATVNSDGLYVEGTEAALLATRSGAGGASFGVSSGGNLLIRERTDAGVNVQAWAQFTSGGGFSFYDADSVVLLSATMATTNAQSLRLLGDGTNNRCAIEFYNAANSARTGFIYNNPTGTAMQIKNENHGGAILLIGENGSGTQYTMCTFDPDGPIAEFNSAAGGVVVGAPTGGDKGQGTINATAVYDDNTLLTDYVFDAHIDGRIDFQKWDDLVPNRSKRVSDGDPETGEPPVDEVEVRTHEPARRFNQADLDPKTYAQKWQARRRLPAFDSPTGQPEQLPVGSWAQRLLETCEVQAIHIEQLRQRIEALEGAANGPEPLGGPNRP